MRSAIRLPVVVVVLGLVAASCGDDGGGAGADGEATATTAAAASEPITGDPGMCTNVPGCDAVVSVTTGLADGDVVQVRIAGWEANGAVGIAQCADEDDPDNPQGLSRGPDGLPAADLCSVLDLPGPAQTEQADGEGVVAFDYAVMADATMEANSAVGQCDAAHDCVLNVFSSGANRFQADAPVVTFPLTFG